MKIIKTNILHLINIILIVFYISAVSFFILTGNSSDMNLNRNKIATFNEGWTIMHDNIVDNNTSLPQNYHLNPGTTYSIERKINTKDFIYPIIRIRSSMMDVDAYIDDQLIYSFDVKSKEKNLHLPYPSSWQLIEIPIANSIGKTLKITFSSPTSQFSGLINSIMIGKGEAIILNIIQSNFLNLIISFLIILLSLFAFSTLFWTKKLGIKKHILYLSSFGVSAGLWIISESTLLQLLIPNRFLISSTSYILNLVLPIIIILFFRDIILEGFKKLITYVASINFILLLVEMILQVTGVVSFITSTLFSIIMIIISASILICCLIFEGYKKNNPRAKQYILMFLALFIFASIIMVLFISGVYQDLEKYLSLGVLGFFLLVMSDVIKSIYELIGARNKSLVYKQLAYQDYLTKGWNRTCFEEDIDNLINQKTTFRLILLDLNYLKQINDSYGHTEGDYAIIESYNALKNTIKDSGKSYRISGDEFACIIYDTSTEALEKYKAQINQILKESSKDKPYEIVLALGTNVFNENQNFRDFYKNVDIEMYKNKKFLKALNTT